MHLVDFCLQVTKDSDEIKKAKARIIDCIFAPSIFHFSMLVILSTVIIFKYVGYLNELKQAAILFRISLI